MSVEAMRWARNMTGLRGDPYLLLLVLAIKHRDGPISESLSDIADAAHMSLSSAKRHLAALSGWDVLTYVPGRGRFILSSYLLHLEKAFTPDHFSEKRSGVNGVVLLKRSRLTALRAEKRSEKRSGLDAYPPLHPPIRNKHLSKNGKGDQNNGTPTPREAVYAELRMLNAGDLTPADLSPRASAVFNALPSAGSIASLSDLADAWVRTEVTDE